MASSLEGIADLTAQITELGVQFATRNLKATVKAAIEPALQRARERIPVGTVPHKTYKGRLVAPGFAQRSLHVENGISKSTGAAYALLGVAREAYYVMFVELGTSKMAAHPWLVPAFASAEDEMLRVLSAELIKRAEKAAQKKAT